MGTCKPLRVLLIAPDASLREVLCAAFSGEGHAIAACTSLLDLLARADGTPCEVALVDLDGSGGGPLDQLQRVCLVRLSELLPLVLLAGNPTAMRHGLSAAPGLTIVPKPFDLQELLAAVQHAARVRPLPAGGQDGQ